jgi:hypothetical protein
MSASFEAFVESPAESAEDLSAASYRSRFEVDNARLFVERK